MRYEDEPTYGPATWGEMLALVGLILLLILGVLAAGAMIIKFLELLLP